jgi:hypothetical protein
VIILTVAALTIGLCEISKARSNDTIERIDSKIEAVMNE